MIRDWLACLAIARSLGRAGRHETGELRRSASPGSDGCLWRISGHRYLGLPSGWMTPWDMRATSSQGSAPWRRMPSLV